MNIEWLDYYCWLNDTLNRTDIEKNRILELFIDNFGISPNFAKIVFENWIDNYQLIKNYLEESQM